MDGTRLMTLARKSLSCLKSLVSWAPGTAKRPAIKHSECHYPDRFRAIRRPECCGNRPCEDRHAPANIALVTNETVTMVGAMASISRSARIRQDATPNSLRLDTIV